MAGTYCITEPKSTLIEAMGGVVTPPPPEYAERIDAPPPGAYEGTPFVWVVAAIEDGVKVLQSTAPGAPEVRWPLTKGEEFSAAYPINGQDGKLWWMSTTRARIQWQGTRIVSGPTFPSTSATCDVQEEIARLGGLITAIEGVMSRLEKKKEI